MTMISTATAAQHLDTGQPLHHRRMKLTKLDRIASVKLFSIVQFLVAHPRCIGTKTANAISPGIVPSYS